MKKLGIFVLFILLASCARKPAGNTTPTIPAVEITPLPRATSTVPAAKLPGVRITPQTTETKPPSALRFPICIPRIHPHITDYGIAIACEDGNVFFYPPDEPVQKYYCGEYIYALRVEKDALWCGGQNIKGSRGEAFLKRIDFKTRTVEDISLHFPDAQVVWAIARENDRLLVVVNESLCFLGGYCYPGKWGYAVTTEAGVLAVTSNKEELYLCSTGKCSLLAKCEGGFCGFIDHGATFFIWTHAGTYEYRNGTLVPAEEYVRYRGKKYKLRYPEKQLELQPIE